MSDKLKPKGYDYLKSAQNFHDEMVVELNSRPKTYENRIFFEYINCVAVLESAYKREIANLEAVIEKNERQT
jgi:hypothetical protein